MARRYEGQVIQGKASQAVSSAVAITFDVPTRAIHANGTGSIVGTLENDAAVSTWSVIEGMEYPLSFASIDASNGVAFNAIF